MALKIHKMSRALRPAEYKNCDCHPNFPHMATCATCATCGKRIHAMEDLLDWIHNTRDNSHKATKQ